MSVHLPGEVLQIIFSELSIGVESERFEDSKICTTTLHSLSLGSQLFNRAATPQLYRAFNIRESEDLDLPTLWLFLRTLTHRKDLADVVRYVGLPQYIEDYWQNLAAGRDAVLKQLPIVSESLTDPHAALPEELMDQDEPGINDAHVALLLGLCRNLTKFEFGIPSGIHWGEYCQATLAASREREPILQHLRHVKVHNGLYQYEDNHVDFNDLQDLWLQPGVEFFQAWGVQLSIYPEITISTPSDVRRMYLHDVDFDMDNLGRLLGLCPALLDLRLGWRVYLHRWVRMDLDELSFALNSKGRQLQEFHLQVIGGEDWEESVSGLITPLQDMTALQSLTIPYCTVAKEPEDDDSLSSEEDSDVNVEYHGPFLQTLFPPSLHHLAIVDCGHAYTTELDERVRELLMDVRYSALQSVRLQRQPEPFRDPPHGWQYRHIVDAGGDWDALFRRFTT